MYLNHLDRKICTCMFLAVRLLTLVAFTAHAVLGCCLSHGSCMQEQVANLTGHICDHDEHTCDSNQVVAGHSHAGKAVKSELVFAIGCDVCPIESRNHSSHCDDLACVFGLAGGSSSFSDLQFVAIVSWVNVSVNYWLEASRHSGYVLNGLERPPHAPSDRAVLQVWRI